MLAHRWQTIPQRGVVRSREPFKFWCAPNIYLERLIISGAVNLVGRSVWKTADGFGHQFITLSVGICVQHGGPEALRRAGLSAVAETCLSQQAAQL